MVLSTEPELAAALKSADLFVSVKLENAAFHLQGILICQWVDKILWREQ
jgi:hypothetical protein